MKVENNKKVVLKHKLKFSIILTAFCAVLLTVFLCVGHAAPSDAASPGLTITVNTNRLISDEAAIFSVTSSDNKEYLITWDFGDDSFNDMASTIEHVEHTYKYADTYIVKIEAVNEEDEIVGTAEKTITVEPPDLSGTWKSISGMNYNPDIGMAWTIQGTLSILTDGSFSVDYEIVYGDKNEDEDYYTSYVDPKEIVLKDEYGTYKHISHDISGLPYDTWEFTIYGGDRANPNEPWPVPCRVYDDNNTFEYYQGAWYREEPYATPTPSSEQNTYAPTSDTTTSEPLSAQIDVSLSADYFKEIDEEITITIMLVDQTGEAAIGQTVTLENMDDGSTAAETTDSYGNAVFMVAHTLGNSKTYTYKLSGLGASKTIEIPVRMGQIELEINPATGKPYTGIMADAANELEINLNFYDMPDGTLSVDIPMGYIKGEKENEKVNIKLTDGFAKITYVTPAYISDDALDGWDEYMSVWKAENVLVFTYTTWDGEEFKYEVPIDLYRPPVMLVHGFTGDATTWMVLDEWLLKRKYSTVRKEYYAGDNSIPAQALQLHRNLRKEFERYNINGVKDGKVDVVAHSMGGLITRYYTTYTEFYTGQVRKLIMVGTPNHGCSWVDLQLGMLQAWLLGKHEIAAKQLYQDNPFIKQLNYGEDIGAHLNPNMQYGIIYSYSVNPKFFGGDAVVAATSAVLNGVASFQVEGDVHSGAINDIPLGPKGTPITDDLVIFDKIKEWLSTDIFRPALKNTKVELMKIEGEVEVQTWDGADRADKVINESELKDGPYEVETYDDIITGDSKAIIRISVNDTAVGYINLDKDSHIRIGNASSRHIDIKMLEGAGRYTTFKNGGIHFAVELVAKNGDWQTVTGLDTDFVISLKDETEVLLIEGEAIVQAQTDADEIDEKIIDSDEAVYIDDTGDISKMDADDFSDMWWEDGFYKTSGMTMILQSAAGLANKMILKAQNIRYSIYVILISVILLIFITLKSRRHKLLLWFFIIVMSAFSILMLYYFATNMQIPILNRIDNLLSGLTDAILKMGTGAILVFILLIGFISMLTGKKRRRGDTDNDYGDDYDLSDDDEDD